MIKRMVCVPLMCGLLLLAGCGAGAPGDRAGGREPGDAPDTGCATRTTLGAVSGTAEGGLCVFRGIPYAAPPTGPLRFRPPQPVAPWPGTLRATDGDRVCPQERDTLTEDYPDQRPAYTDEDCLRLNIWTPQPDHAPRPVIVFLHGGAARFGTAAEPRYSGATLASRGDAVVVTVNYRLGVLGWAELGGLDPSYRGSGNNGLRDQMAALSWVHQHIADFGGDPGNITAVGESEGAVGLSAMLATDHPQRLFRRVILESGSGYLVHATPTPPPPVPLRALETMPVADLLGLQEKAIEQAAPGVLGAVYYAPYVDGSLVPDTVTRRVAEGNAKGVDILLGTNTDEVNFFGQLGPGGLGQVAGQYSLFFPPELAGDRARMLAAYRGGGRSAQDAELAMLTDQAMRLPAIRLAQAQSRWRPTYLYEFAWKPPAGLGAVHTAELPFVFGTLRFAGIPGGAQALRADPTGLSTLSDQMVDAWTSFARTGDPDARRTVPRPDWPAYQPPRRATMVWDTTPRVVDDPGGPRRGLWDPAALTTLRLNPPTG